MNHSRSQNFTQPRLVKLVDRFLGYPSHSMDSRRRSGGLNKTTSRFSKSQQSESPETTLKIQQSSPEATLELRMQDAQLLRTGTRETERSRRVPQRVKSVKRGQRPVNRCRVASVGAHPISVEHTSTSTPPIRLNASVDDLLDITNRENLLNAELPVTDTASDLMVFTPEAPFAQSSNQDLIIDGTIDTATEQQITEALLQSHLLDEMGYTDGTESSISTEQRATNVQLLCETFSATNISVSPIRRRNPQRSKPAISTVSLDSILAPTNNIQPADIRRNSETDIAAVPGSSNTNLTSSSQTSLYSLASSNFSASSVSSGIDTLMSYDNTLDGIHIGEKVVWFSHKEVPEIGAIKWLGKINQKHFAGVEFNNAVGNSSGTWKGRRLFTAHLTKGRFVPITELILYADYAQGVPHNEPAKINYPSWEKKDKCAPATFICVICQDPLVSDDNDKEEYSDNADDGLIEADIIATHCGHLFHLKCIQKWFNTKKKLMQPCPYCQRIINTQEMTKIFPVQA